ncbi:MAG: chemotaxis protein CheB [Gammaproteobacteria bacterium]|nr:chemotaxis protein CheB [Gammaproteobacteria bacterium]MBU1491477.1 chemotaxis protein CheB [Gammaproteobacteria bacterium]MBU2066217.1 chemotaxis protein CheB [Gammaproteobacteria bacterium]MBU2139885.1 chemotaxis protein CheB [Gammaproteobacteria bacterium]MBU2215540.1 chemotaxis protein CheB [Gammaproteobacteria bacterium]
MSASLLTRRIPLQALMLGGSAGGVTALLCLLETLPADYRLPVVMLLHLPDDRHSELAQVFQRRLALRVKEAEGGETLQPACVYVAPPGYHLLIEQDRSFSLSREAPQHHSRPSIDVLFESAADAYGAALAAVLLTGANQDGAAGLAAVKAHGGLTIVQDPTDAQVPTMPEAALALHTPDYVLALPDLRALLKELDKSPC